MSQPEVEFADVDTQPMRGEIRDVLGGLVKGKLGLYSVVRHLSDENWQSCYQTDPFTYAMPHLVSRQKWYQEKFNSLDGSIYFVSDFQKLIDKTKQVLSNGELSNGGFYIPLYMNGGYDLLVKRRMFSFGNGLYVVPFLIPHQVEQGKQVGLHLIVINVNKSTMAPAKCNLEITSNAKLEWDAEEDSKLHFNLASGKYQYSVIPLLVTEKTKPKEHDVKVIAKTSFGNQAASAVATAALTIGVSALLGGGMFGSSWGKGEGFTTKLTVVKRKT